MSDSTDFFPVFVSTIFYSIVLRIMQGLFFNMSVEFFGGSKKSSMVDLSMTWYQEPCQLTST